LFRSDLNKRLKIKINVPTYHYLFTTMQTDTHKVKELLNIHILAQSIKNFDKTLKRPKTSIAMCISCGEL